MKKKDEREDMTSCFNRAHEDEMVFVLLGRDVAAPHAIRAWVERRLETGKNQPTDEQIKDALKTAWAMEEYRERRGT